ncbi:MAG: SIMPL domain-containing protein [Bacteroidota bacterium]
MKQTLLIGLFLSFHLASFAQILGNYDRNKNQSYDQAQEVYSNTFTGLNNQYRSVAKIATIAGENVLELSINALSNQRASSYTAIFNVVQIGQTAESTNASLNQQITAFTDALETIGIQKEDWYVDMVNFLPKYEYDVSKKLFSKKTFKEIPIGFELQKNVHIRFDDPAVLDEIVTAAAQQEIYDIVKVDYFVNNPQAIYSELRQAAMDYAQNIKLQYRDLKISLDSSYVIAAENAWVAYPGDRYETYQAFSSQKLSNKQQSSSKVDKADKPTSRFYDAIAANNYDIVINPEILEPAVQFSYNLVLRFTLPERVPNTQTVVQKEFVLVTPEGVVRQLKIE